MFATKDNPTPEISLPSLPSKVKGGKGWWWILSLALLSFALWRIFPTWGASSNHGEAAQLAPVPVTLATAKTENFPLYLDGIGTVQAYNSVQVNARIAGQIQEIRFQEGEEVKQGDILAIIDPRTYQAQYDQALSKQHQDEAQLQSAQLTLARDQQLLAKAVLDKETYDTQKYMVAQLTATVQADAANVELQKTQLDYAQVTAPISGRTGVRLLDAGNQVSIGANGASNSSTIVVINQIQPIYVSFTLPQQDLSKIRDPLLAHKILSVIALDRNNQTVLSHGSLSVMDNQIDTATSTIRLKAVFANGDDKLWPGQFVNVRLLVGERPNAVVVPAESIQLGPDGSYVYVVVNNQAKIRSVVTGPSEAGTTLIESGLQAGEIVVTDGQYRLQQDSMIKTTPSQTPESFEKHPAKSS